MSYQVLARKWRPQTFHEVIGQPHVLTALENGLAQNRVHHAYLFSGTRGVGKTSIARLLAKSLNCETGVTSTPCGQCANCQAIDQGRFVDLLEIDAASRTKVDDTRELLDNVQYKPAQGRYKVYLIDEVHMLSKHSFNALLKTLEEPPEYVKFLLATTDPQKLPITVLSRCLQFHLKAILPEQIEQQLVDILTHEQATFEQPALTVIAKAADGSMRDALSLTDQALAFGAGHIEYNAVLKMLGTIDQSHLHYLLHFVASGNSKKVFEKIQEFVHLGADFAALHQELASLCHQIALAQLQLNANVTNKTTVQLLAERLTPEEVQLFYQIALEGYKDYSYAPNGKVALEMTVMRLLAFKPANYVDIDEAMLVQAEQVETIEPITEIIKDSVQSFPVKDNTVVNTGTAKPTVSFDNTVPAIDTNHVQPNTFPTDIEQTIETVEPSALIETSVIKDESPQELIQEEVVDSSTTSNDIITPRSDNSNTTLLESSNSRNMLRSHRLKREALKKTEAAVDQVSNDTEQSVAPESLNLTKDNHLNVIESISVNNQKNTLSNDEKALPQSENIDVVKSIEIDEPKTLNITSSNTATLNNQELPPLSSYQEQSNQQDYSTEHGSFSPDFEEVNINENKAITQTEMAVGNDKESVQVTSEMHDIDDLPYANKKIEKIVIESKENDDISALNHLNSTQTDVILVTNDNLQSAEIDIANYVEGKMTDPWFLAIQEMQLVGFEKLLAKSAVMQKNEGSIVLTLHSPQQHLINNHSLCDDLKVKLRHYYGQEYTVNIEVGEVSGSYTPIALELIVYQQYLDEAKLSIKNDPIVQTFVQDYAAKVYENSVVPL